MLVQASLHSSPILAHIHILIYRLQPVMVLVKE